MRVLKILGAIVLVSCVSGYPIRAQAQQTVLPGIVIYGSKSELTLDDSTSSVGVVTSEQIERGEITSFRSAFRQLSNVADSDWVDAGFTIRGVSSEGLTPGGAPLASFYIDGIQQTVNGTRRGARGLWDVEQVEVYRGPQSTLQGRAALAGAIHVKTKDPTYEPEVAVRAGVGTHATRDAAAMFNIPIVAGGLALRVAAEYSTSENDINYPTYETFPLFERFSTAEYGQIRAKLLMEPGVGTNTKGVLTYSFSKDSPHLDDIGGPALGFNFNDKRGDFNLPTFTEARTADNHNLGYELRTDLAAGLTFTSLSTFSHNLTDRPSVNLGAAGETNVVLGEQKQSILTQELRLNYTGARVKAVAGIYLAREKTDAFFERPNFFGFARDDSRDTRDTDNAALFGELTYEFVPTWSIIAGGRADHTKVDVTSSFIRTFFGGGGTDNSFSGSFSETNFLPKIGLKKDLTPNQSLALVYSEGFRTGGVSQQRSTGRIETVDPEKAANYELSYKGSFMSNRLSLSGNVFYTQFTGQQVEVQPDPSDPASQFTTNAGKSSSRGFEIEAKYNPTSSVSTFLSVGYVDTNFDEFNSAEFGDLSGLPFPEAPKWSIAFGANYKMQSGWFAGFDAKYTDDFLARFGQDPQEFVDGYFVVNAQAGYETDNVAVRFYAENLFDNSYFVYNDNDIAATLGPRRVVGVRATLKN